MIDEHLLNTPSVLEAPRASQVPCEVIAEIGVNHDGSLERALELVDLACRAGASAVKFQTFRAEELASPGASRVAYQREGDDGSSSQLEMLRRLELSAEDFRAIARHCERRGVEFLSTPFDRSSVHFLVGLGVRRIKIGSGDLNNLPLLEEIGGLGLPVILSTGMAHDEEIEEALVTLDRAGAAEVVLLHCISRYPTPLADLNLSRISWLASRFGRRVGFSDHSRGAGAAGIARSLGATIIEKHFTDSNDLPGPDHAASADPETFREVVDAVRRAELMLGDGSRTLHPDEEEARRLVRKSLVALRDIEPGEVFNEANLAILRPGEGIPPREWSHVLGRRAARSVLAGQPLDWDQVL